MFNVISRSSSPKSNSKSNGIGPVHAPSFVRMPVTVPSSFENGSPQLRTPSAKVTSHTERLYTAIPHADKERHTVAGASHYYIGQRAQLAECVGLYTDWLTRKGLS